MAVFFVACSSQKKTVKPAQPEVVASKKQEVTADQLKKNQTVYSTFTTKAISKLAINGKDYDVTLNIRIKNKELIWQGIGEGALTQNPEYKEARINEFVAKILTKYPPIKTVKP